MQKVTILGSTGSIGRNTLQVIKEFPDKYEILALTSNRNIELLARQAILCNAQFVAVAEDSLYKQLKALLSSYNIEVASGSEGLKQAASLDSSVVMSAIVGVAALEPTMEAVRRGAKVTLANKECLVCAGNIMTDAAQESGAQIIPVDSEHNAIFQVLDSRNPQNISRIILTASGGPFRENSLEQMRKVMPIEAVKHPNWNMGAKISIDSATMMNKGLEIIEAFNLFPVNANQIEVVVHPESVVHSLVEYVDGSVLAQLGTPDMRIPIAVALAWPNRLAIPYQKLNLTNIGKLTFHEIDRQKFPAIKLAYDVLEKSGNYPAVFSTANEVAVAEFLAGRIGFLDIVPVVERVIESTEWQEMFSINDVMEQVTNAFMLANDICNNSSIKNFMN